MQFVNNFYLYTIYKLKKAIQKNINANNDINRKHVSKFHFKANS